MEEFNKEPERQHGAKAGAAEASAVPKHRFDCVNLCLKETKEALRAKTLEAEAGKRRITALERALADAKVETAIAVHRAKNLAAVKALIDLSSLKLGQDGDVPGLEEQILRIKKSQNFLFESEGKTAYVLVPVRHGDALNKSITNYIKRTEK